MTAYDLARGLHILAVIAWMAGLLFLPRLYAYDAEQGGKSEPLKSEMQALLRAWQTRLLRIIVNPAMILAWGFGLWLMMASSSAGWQIKIPVVAIAVGVATMFFLKLRERIATYQVDPYREVQR